MNDIKIFDNSFLDANSRIIAGVDEAGRGPLAGPVVAAAVVFNPNIVIRGVKDSKKISEKLREELYIEIVEKASAYSIGIVDEKTIDQINILRATMSAMKQAVKNLKTRPDLVLIDGNRIFDSDINSRSIVKGDSKSFSIAAASILAKVTRDRIMREASLQYPNYLWHKNKGYGTKEHIQAINKHGPTPYHRMTFLSKILNN